MFNDISRPGIGDGRMKMAGPPGHNIYLALRDGGNWFIRRAGLAVGQGAGRRTRSIKGDLHPREQDRDCQD